MGLGGRLCYLCQAPSRAPTFFRTHIAVWGLSSPWASPQVGGLCGWWGPPRPLCLEQTSLGLKQPCLLALRPPPEEQSSHQLSRHVPRGHLLGIGHWPGRGQVPSTTQAPEGHRLGVGRGSG